MDIQNKLIWLDLEMTGLDPEDNVIIEIATIVTDGELNELATGPVFAITQAQSELDKMDAWNQKQHKQSGLIARVKESQTTTAMAEQETLSFLSPQLQSGASPMCGNSICMDRRFLAKHMPKLHLFFHYRNLDVSTLKILADLWAPQVKQSHTKQSQHLALSDIRDSIAELRHYRQHFIAKSFAAQ